MELNSGLVAVIGARGSGKTALVDLIAAGLDDALVAEIERVIFNAHPLGERQGADSFKELLDAYLEGSRLKRVHQREVKSLCDNDLQTLLDFCGSPQNDAVERVMGIEPTLEAWEAAVLPLNYTRQATNYTTLINALREAATGGAGQSIHNQTPKSVDSTVFNL